MDRSTLGSCLFSILLSLYGFASYLVDNVDLIDDNQEGADEEVAG
eukprot:CAMPEP_0179028894 /NCGR_PEP_ID=MMETSP0796-20121207/9775_1 /TAXON_ID=73915 /ORGANISM="Pyrodinium bahamense, Strain pbaha01" /LENGTH=44 /DNA_ID= /DNA_START= /DNA_END= /DNA_ORIENTATION=